MRRAALCFTLLPLVLAAACRHRVDTVASSGGSSRGGSVGAWESTTRHLVDSVAARMAELELQRLSLLVTWGDQAPAVQDLVAELSRLEHLLAGEPDAREASRVTVVRRLDALDAHHASLVLQRERLLVRYAAGNRQVQAVDRALEQLSVRRLALAALLQAPSSRR